MQDRALGAEVRCLLVVLISVPIVDFMANAIAQLLAKRTHKVSGRGKSRAMQFGNGQSLSQCPEK